MLKKADASNATLQINIPEQQENLMLPSPELLTFYKNLNERTLWLDCGVDETFLEFERYILQINREDKGVPVEDRKPIKLMFFSYGGDLDVNNSLIDVIKLSKTPIYGFNMGAAASAGCFIYLACHKRFALRTAQFLIHKGSGSFSGTYDEVISQVENYTKQIGDLADYLLEHTSISEALLEERLGSEWYISAQEAVELGMCDAIISDIDEVC